MYYVLKEYEQVSYLDGYKASNSCRSMGAERLENQDVNEQNLA